MLVAAAKPPDLMGSTEQHKDGSGFSTAVTAFSLPSYYCCYSLFLGFARFWRQRRAENCRGSVNRAVVIRKVPRLG